MSKELQIFSFEGTGIDVLTKGDVNIEFEGDVLFSGRQVAEVLGYSNPSKAITNKVKNNHKYKIKNSDLPKWEIKKLNNAGEYFLSEKGVFALIMQSDMPKAEEFQDLVYDIVMQVKQTGKFDVRENKIQQIQDDKERELTLKLYQFENMLKTSPNDMMVAINYNQTKMEQI